MTDHFEYNINAVSQELRIRPEILEKLIKSFSKTLFDKIEKLEVLIPENNIEQIRAIMHEVKGTSGNLRLTDIYRSADKMHVAVKSSEEKNIILGFFEEFKKESNKFFHFINSLNS